LSQLILIVDDDRLTTHFLGTLLQEQGYDICVANSGELALRIAAETQPDLILLDITMHPGMDGIETCRRLKEDETTHSTPIIFLTGKDDEDSMLRAFDTGAADSVLKPCVRRVLLARVRTHMELGLLSRHLEEALAERTRELHAANAQLRRLAREMTLVEEAEPDLSNSVTRTKNPLSPNAKSKCCACWQKG